MNEKAKNKGAFRAYLDKKGVTLSPKLYLWKR
jgi:hypothetical protein